MVVISGPYSKQDFSLTLSSSSEVLVVISLEFQSVCSHDISRSHDGKSAAQAFDGGPCGEKEAVTCPTNSRTKHMAGDNNTLCHKKFVVE